MPMRASVGRRALNFNVEIERLGHAGSPLFVVELCLCAPTFVLSKLLAGDRPPPASPKAHS